LSIHVFSALLPPGATKRLAAPPLLRDFGTGAPVIIAIVGIGVVDVELVAVEIGVRNIAVGVPGARYII